MSGGLTTTFELLATTPNQAALDVLLPELDSPHAEVQTAALQAIVQRPNPSGHRAVVDRANAFTEPLQQALADVPSRMQPVLREALLAENRRQAYNASELTVWSRDYDLLPTLIGLIEDPNHPHRDLGRRTVLRLAESLFDELCEPRDYHRRRDPQIARRNALGALEKPLARFPQHGCRELLEAYLILVPRDDAGLKSILFDSNHAARGPMLERLASSRCRGAMRLLVSFLEDPHPPRATLRILGSRKDGPFVHLLLGRVGDSPSPGTAENLRRLKSIAWANPAEGVLDRLGEEEQRAAVHFLMASGLNEVAKFRVLKHLITQGTPAGRLAAVEALAEYQFSEASELIPQAADDDDPHVQAAALSQLRDRGLPGATALLLERLDSPSAIVRAAVCEALSEFRFERFAASFETLSEEVRRSTGRLVKQVDPDTLLSLRQELSSSSRPRRLRAFEMVVAMDAVEELKGALIDRLEDDDHLVRIEAARALAASDSETSSQGVPA